MEEIPPMPTEPRKSILPWILTILFLLIVFAGVTYFTYRQNQQIKSDLQSQIDDAKNKLAAQLSPTPTLPTPTASPTASASPSATAEAQYKKLTDTLFKFSFEYPKTWYFSSFVNGEGYHSVLYTNLTASTMDTHVFDQSVEPTKVLAIQNITEDLTQYVNQLKQSGTPVQNQTKITLGSAKYDAIRFDDGGGIGGIETSYVTEHADANGAKTLIKVSTYNETSADLQHLLGSITFN